MRKILLKDYARMHRMSIFQVIQKLQRGELQGESTEIDGRKTQYVFEQEEISPAVSDSATRETDEKPDENLREEIRKLAREIEKLRLTISECCRSKS